MPRPGDEQPCPTCGERIIFSGRQWTEFEPPWVEHHCDPQTAATVRLARAIEEQTWVLKEQTQDATVIQPLTPLQGAGSVVPIRRPGPVAPPRSAEPEAADVSTRLDL